MSAIEKALLEAVDFAKKYLRTFAYLVFKPTDIIDSINPTTYSKEKFIDPFLFFVISILPTVFIWGKDDVSADYSRLTNSLPGFIQNLTISEIFLVTLPYICGTYLYTVLMSLFFYRHLEWRKSYKKFIFYCISIMQLTFAFWIAFKSVLFHLFFDDVNYGTNQYIIGRIILIEFIPLTAIIPLLVSSFSSLWKVKKGIAFKFAIVPIVTPIFFLFMLGFIRIYANYDKSLFAMPNDLICQETDGNKFQSEFRTCIYGKCIFLRTSLRFYNSSNKVFFLPNSFDVDYTDEASKYDSNSTNKKILHFASLIQFKHAEDSLLIKPNQYRKVDYECTTQGEDFKILPNFWTKGNGYFEPLIQMRYWDILNNNFHKTNLCNIHLVVDSSIIHAYHKDSLK